MAKTLPVQSQQYLLAKVTDRITPRQGDISRAEAFLNTCLSNPIRPANAMDAVTDICEMREERGEQLL